MEKDLPLLLNAEHVREMAGYMAKKQLASIYLLVFKKVCN
jgi:hypothetical protein